MSDFDLTFVLCAVIFNLLIIGIYITSKHEGVKLGALLGKITIGLSIPLSVVLVAYIVGGKPVSVVGKEEDHMITPAHQPSTVPGTYARKLHAAIR